MVEALDLAPSKPGVPYKLNSLCGETIYIPLSKSATRLLVTGKETDNAFAVVGSGGSESDPIGFHYHREAHDVFVCVQGKMNVWAGDKCRTLEPGDFASVPPGTVHQYQILGVHAEFVGLIVPGGWEEFFRFIGEPYDGALWPMNDNRNFFETVLPKLKAAAEKFDMVPQPHLKSFAPQSWEDTDSKLPGSTEPYFLKNASGPAVAIDGMTIRPLCTGKESAGRFSIGSIEGSNVSKGHSSEPTTHLKSEFHHVFYVAEGRLSVTVNATATELSQYETLFVPAGTNFSFAFESRYAKTFVFANGEGVTSELYQSGRPLESGILPEQ